MVKNDICLGSANKQNNFFLKKCAQTSKRTHAPYA